MKKPFLEKVAGLLAGEAHFAPEDSLILLPNRRSGLFLKHHLMEQLDRSSWLPEMRSIGELVDSLSPLRLCESVEAVFRLYDLYTAGTKETEALDEFYHWGELMLSDFDEIDKYLVDPDMLFRNLSDLKAIEEPTAGMNEDQLKFISQFWKGFQEGPSSAEKRKFLQIWDRLPSLYHGLQSILEEEGEAYPGMQYRALCKHIAEGQQEALPWKQIWVVGFNALNACEIQIFHWMRRQGAAFFWDVDPSWLEDPLQEAGRFMRDNLRRFPQHPSFQLEGSPDPDQEIRIFDLPSDVLQARAVRKILEETREERRDECTDTAVVLCDEELLMPVLLSFPGSVPNVNITMGYPLSLTAVYGFLQSLFSLQHSARTGKDGIPLFFHRDVSDLLMHPFMAEGKGKKGHPVLETMARENRVTVPADCFEGAVERLVFRRPDTVAGFFAYLRDILAWLMERGEDPEEGLRQVQYSFLTGLAGLVNHLERLTGGREDMNINLIQRILRKMAMGLRIPFEGEPLQGLQLMGILETRLLDFRHVIMLSMNEEVMPAGHGAQSYIPYSLRLAFGMPGKEDRDAIYAYYFARLMKRARRVDLLFNSTTEGVRTGEMSRYLQGLIFERDIMPVRPSLEVRAREVLPLVVKHDDLISERLRRYSDPDEEAYLSPSAINTYISCPLKFYFRYLAGLGEADSVQEEIDAAGFGTVVHDCMKILYDEVAGKYGGWITEEGLRNLLASENLEKILWDTFIEQQYHGRKTDKAEGRNILILEVMERYVRQIIQTDLSIAPFELLATEDSYSREMDIKVGQEIRRIRLGGKIDRVDQVNGNVRVIDYKTGKAANTFASIASLFDPELSSRNPAALQTLLYAWLLGDQYGTVKLVPGLYIMQKLMERKTDTRLFLGSGRDKEAIEDFTLLEEDYLSLLREGLERLFNPEVPFDQTTNEKICQYCDFAGICERQNI